MKALGKWSAKVAVVLVVAVVALAGISYGLDQLPGKLNPFKEEKTDRSGPAVVQSIQKLAKFEAAEATIQQVVDLEDNGNKYIPGDGERRLFVATGTVTATVDFAALEDGAVILGPKGSGQVTVTLPKPQLGEPNLDPESSYTASLDDGIVGRVGDVFSSDDDKADEVYREAEKKLSQAAEDIDLAATAETNTEQWLTGFLTSLGYTDITIAFEPDPT